MAQQWLLLFGRLKTVRIQRAWTSQLMDPRLTFQKRILLHPTTAFVSIFKITGLSGLWTHSMVDDQPFYRREKQLRSFQLELLLSAHRSPVH